MSAPKGNQFWKLRSKDGRDRIWKDADSLLEACYEYFQQCDDNPWEKNDILRSGENAGKVVRIPAQRPYTKAGLCVFLGIAENTWENYKENSGEDFLRVLTHVEQVIKANQLEGATVGAYNPSIVARLLGLKERTVNENYEQPLFPDVSKDDSNK